MRRAEKKRNVRNREESDGEEPEEKTTVFGASVSTKHACPTVYRHFTTPAKPV